MMADRRLKEYHWTLLEEPITQTKILSNGEKRYDKYALAECDCKKVTRKIRVDKSRRNGNRVMGSCGCRGIFVNSDGLIQCCACKASRFETDFYPNEKRHTGLSPRCKRCEFVAYLKSTYGLSYDDYIAMLIAQNYRCKICGIHNDEITHLKKEPEITFECRNLVIDHCHKSGKVRGLLCPECNLDLGVLEKILPKMDKFNSYLSESEK